MLSSILHTVLISFAPLFLWLFKHFAQKITNSVSSYVAQKSKNQYWSDGIEAAVYDAKHGKKSGVGNGSINLGVPIPQIEKLG